MRPFRRSDIQPRVDSWDDTLLRIRGDDTNGTNRAVRSRAQDSSFGVACRIDDLRLSLRIVREHMGGKAQARAVTDAEVVIHRDTKASRHGGLAPPNREGFQRSELHAWLILEGRRLELDRGKPFGERSKDFLSLDPRK